MRSQMRLCSEIGALNDLFRILWRKREEFKKKQSLFSWMFPGLSELIYHACLAGPKRLTTLLVCPQALPTPMSLVMHRHHHQHLCPLVRGREKLRAGQCTMRSLVCHFHCLLPPLAIAEQTSDYGRTVNGPEATKEFGQQCYSSDTNMGRLESD